MPLSSKRPSQADKNRKRMLAAVTDDNGQAMSRLNADIDAEQYRQLKIQAAGERRSISDIIRELVTDYLSK